MPKDGSSAQRSSGGVLDPFREVVEVAAAGGPARGSGGGLMSSSERPPPAYADRQVEQVEKGDGESAVSARLHWLTGTFPVEQIDVLRAVNMKLFEGEWESYPARQYGTSIGLLGGAVRLSWSREGEDGAFTRPEAMLEVTGKGCDALSGGELSWLLVQVADLGLSCTRLDAAVDVPVEWVRLQQVYRCAKRRLCGPLHPSRGLEDFKTHGKTVNFGERGRWGSGSMVCVYDKSRESGGVVEGTRFEARYFRKKAAAAFALVLGDKAPWEDMHVLAPEQLARRLGELVGGAIWFSEKDHGAVREAKWWKRIRNELGNARIRIESPAPCKVDEFPDNFRRRFAQSFATAYDLKLMREGQAAADSWVVRLLDEGRIARSKRHERLIGQASVKGETDWKETLPF